MQSAVNVAESKKIQYLITPFRQMKGTPAFAILPGSYRIEGAQPKGEYKIPITNGRSIYYLLVSADGYGVDAKGWVEVVNGFATIKLNLNLANEKYVLLVFPRLTESKLPDYWEGFDTSRDELLSSLRSTKFGEGFRGILNPLGTPESWTIPQGGFVPDTEMFRLEFQSFLESKYNKNIENLVRSWRLKAFEIDTFKQAARMVALFSKTRGVDRLFDPQSEAMIPVEMRDSNYWTDVQTVINNAALRRNSRLAESIRRTINVPVIFEWLGWSPVYDSLKPAGNGLAMKANGGGPDGTQILAQGTSSFLAWENRGWFLMSSFRGFENPENAMNLLSDSVGLGAKGWYFNLDEIIDYSFIERFQSQIRAMPTIANEFPKALYYPENARFPADTMRLPAGFWWIPTPAAGNRIEYGYGYEGYKHNSTFASFIAIWRTNQPARVRLLCREPARLIFKSHDGNPIETKINKDSVELTLGTVPIMITGSDEIPVPADALDQLVQDYKLLSDFARKRGVNIDDPRYFFEDSYRKVKENPGGAFANMVENYRKMQIGVGAFWWKEAELADKSNFGDLLLSPACSEGRALLLSSPITPPANLGYFAEYVFRTNNPQECDFWIAGNFPKEVKPYVEILVGNLKLPLPERAVAGYGDSFNWYKIGRFTPAKGTTTITIRLAANAPVLRMSLDVILLTPFPFRPSGISMPVGY